MSGRQHERGHDAPPLAGQQIAEMGSSGASRVELGFQIRKDGNPVDPLNYLPAK